MADDRAAGSAGPSAEVLPRCRCWNPQQRAPFSEACSLTPFSSVPRRSSICRTTEWGRFVTAVS